jgi:hypothetical protein
MHLISLLVGIALLATGTTSIPAAAASYALSGFERTRSSGEAREIPSWIKNNAGWWAAEVDDSDASAEEIPSWIVPTTEWWATGNLDPGVLPRRRTEPEPESGLFSGLWIPRGKSGRQFLLVLDEPSREALLARMVGESARKDLELVGTPKFLLKLRRDGGAVLHVRALARISDGKGRIRYRARLAATPPQTFGE